MYFFFNNSIQNNPHPSLLGEATLCCRWMKSVDGGLFRVTGSLSLEKSKKSLSSTNCFCLLGRPSLICGCLHQYLSEQSWKCYRSIDVHPLKYKLKVRTGISQPLIHFISSALGCLMPKQQNLCRCVNNSGLSCIQRRPVVPNQGFRIL